MCTRFNRIILLMITFLSASMFVDARDLSPYKKTCSEIGFKEGTEKFGKCVVKLIKRDKASVKAIEREREYEYQEEQREIERRNALIQKKRERELAREKELELSRQRLELEERRVKIEEERANREKWNNISKGLKTLSDDLYGNQNQRNDDYERQLCINDCRFQGDNFSYCQRVCR